MSSDHPAPRASDQDREQVVERLREAAADGRLDMDEFNERMTSAYSARTRPELTPLLADLQAPSGHDVVPKPAPEVGRISGALCSTDRRGLWEVPRRLDVSLFMASARLDLTAAQVPAQMEIDVGLVLSSVEVMVPPGVRVETDSVRNVLSSVTDRTRVTQPPAATIVVRGHATLSSVTVKTPNALAQWWRSVTT